MPHGPNEFLHVPYARAPDGGSGAGDRADALRQGARLKYHPFLLHRTGWGTPRRPGWPLGKDQPVRARVVGGMALGEHAGRYDHVARRLNEWGFAVRATTSMVTVIRRRACGLTSDNRLLG